MAFFALFIDNKILRKLIFIENPIICKVETILKVTIFFHSWSIYIFIFFMEFFMMDASYSNTISIINKSFSFCLSTANLLIISTKRCCLTRESPSLTTLWLPLNEFIWIDHKIDHFDWFGKFKMRLE